jgi:hypothetical protein
MSAKRERREVAEPYVLNSLIRQEQSRLDEIDALLRAEPLREMGPLWTLREDAERALSALLARHPHYAIEQKP